MIETLAPPPDRQTSGPCGRAASVRVGPALDADAAQWDAFVKLHPEGTLFHGWAWRRSVIETFGHEPFYLLARREGRTEGVLPLFLVRSVVAGRLLVSVPYGVYGGALVTTEESAEALLGELHALAEREGVGRVDIRSVRPLWAGMPTIDNCYVAFSKALPDSEDQVLAGLPRKARAAARQARDKHGLTVEFGAEHLPAVWGLYSRSMRRLGSPNYPLRFFEELVANTPGRHLVSLIRYRDKAAAGLVSFIHRDTLMPYFAGCDERLERYRPNNFLYLTAMEWGVRAGLKRFDLGRSRRGNQGSFNFKRHQGFEPEPLGYQAWGTSQGKATRLTPDSAGLQWAIGAWKRLPLCVTRPVGGWLAKSIPG